jgi:hypothetical protein
VIFAAVWQFIYTEGWKNNNACFNHTGFAAGVEKNDWKDQAMHRRTWRPFTLHSITAMPRYWRKIF